MAVTSLQLAYAEIRENLGTYLSVNRTASNWHANTTTDVLNILRKGLRKFYYQARLGPGQPAHQWSFLRPYFTTTTAAPYSTGTITVVNGAVTGSGTTFTSAAVNAWLVVGGTYYEVATYSGATSIQLVDTTIDYASGTAYELRYYRYDLPSDFVSLEGRLTFAADESERFRPLEYRSEEHLRHFYQDGSTDTCIDEPTYYSIYPSAPATTAIQSWKLILWPSTDAIYHLRGRYHLQMADLDGTNLYPPGGAQHSETILEAVLSEAEATYNDQLGPHVARYQELLESSISLDRQISTADTLGVVPIQGERRSRRILNPHDYLIQDGYTIDDYLVT